MGRALVVLNPPWDSYTLGSIWIELVDKVQEIRVKPSQRPELQRLPNLLATIYGYIPYPWHHRINGNDVAQSVEFGHFNRKRTSYPNFQMPIS